MAWVEAEPTLLLKQIKGRIAARWGISLSLTRVCPVAARRRGGLCRARATTRQTRRDSAASKKVRHRMRQAREGRYRLLSLDEAWWGLTTQLRPGHPLGGWARRGGLSACRSAG